MKFTNFMFRMLIIAAIVNNKAYSQLPIKVARTISFTTDEASYMDVDISGDGKTILFTILGDLYKVSAQGGEATQLTRGLAYNAAPKWSPDGNRIAYISDISGSRHVNVRNLSGSFHRTLGESDGQLNSSKSIFWTNDGRYILADQYLYLLTGGKHNQTFVKGNAIGVTSGGQWIYAGQENGTIYTYNPETDSSKLLVSLGKKDASNFIVSPDGNWLCYVLGAELEQKKLVIRNLATGQETLTNDFLGIYYQRNKYCFGEDSKFIFIGYGGKIHKVNVATGENQIIPFTAKVNADCGRFIYNTFRVTHDSLPVKYIRQVSKSPDGKQLVFNALNKIFIMDLPNGKPRVLVDQPFSQFCPKWSPDGKWVAYTSWTDAERCGLWKVQPTSTVPVQLMKSTGFSTSITWSPDNRTIAMAIPRTERGTPMLLIVSATSGKLEMADSLELESLGTDISFSADGQKYYYTKFGHEKINNKSVSTIYGAMLMEGDKNEVKKKRVLAYINGDASNSKQISLSPDGKFLIFGIKGNLYLLPYFAGNEPIKLFEPELNRKGGYQKLPLIKFGQGFDPCWDDSRKTFSWVDVNHFYTADPAKILETAVNLAAKKADQVFADNGMITPPLNFYPDVEIRLQVPRYYGKGLMALKNARVITMAGDKIFERGTVLIKDGRITAMGASEKVVIPTEAQIYDIAGKTIMPGMIDLHDHSVGVFPSFPSAALTSIYPFLRDKSDNRGNLAKLAYGVTTARNPGVGSHHPDSYIYKELVETGGVLGPRFFPAGGGLSPDGNDGNDNINSLNQARSLVRERVAYGVTFIKQYAQNTRIQRQWLLMASSEAGVNMTNEGESPLGLIMQIKDGSTGVEHNYSMKTPDVYKDFKTFISKAKTFFTPTLIARMATSFDTRIGDDYFSNYFQAHPDNKYEYFMGEKLKSGRSFSSNDSDSASFFDRLKIAAEFRKGGAKVTMGSHGDIPGIASQFETWALQMGGLSNLQALQAATIMGAEAIGIQKDLGSIEVGKIADMIILNSNPLEDIHNTRDIKYVMKDGVLYDGDTLTKLWPLKNGK